MQKYILHGENSLRVEANKNTQKMEDKHMYAKTKWFSKKLGYGFLVTDDDQEIFVHQSNLRMDGFRYLRRGQMVDFKIGSGKNDKKQAVDVTPLYVLT